MKFIHCPPVELKELESENVDNRRYYLTPNGKYVSITTVLSHFKKKSIYEWRKRVGEEEANRISSVASSRGTKVHSLCEKYLLNEEIDTVGIMPDALSSFYSIKKYLNNINNIHFLEVPLYSDRLKVAGRADCIGNYEDKLSIIDFKTSKNEKQEEWIEDYFLQAAAYLLMYYELTGIKIEKIVIIIGVDFGESQVFIKDAKEYIPKIIKKIREYQSIFMPYQNLTLP